MIDGGQQITSIETHLQTGGELFDSDPKGALGAYYQAVSIEPSHIEGWNQIGRLMFDLKQFAEAKMVFTKVEQLANEQGLPDWAEMARQNIDLTGQTLADQSAQPSVQEEPVQVEPEPAQAESTEAVPVEPVSTFSEETQSIEDISNIAAVAELPVAELPVVDVASEAPIVQAPVIAAVPLANDRAGAAIAPGVEPQLIVQQAAPLETALVEQAAPVMAAVVANDQPAPGPVEDIPVASAPVEVAILEALAPASDLNIAQAATPDVIAQPVAPISPAAPTPLADRLAAGSLPVVNLPAAPLLGGQAAQPAAPAFGQPAIASPGQALGQLQGQIQTQMQGQAQPPIPPQMAPQMPPPSPFPAYPGATGAPPIQTPAHPLPVSPPVDAKMEAPSSRTSSSKIALMITGVVGAAGIGIGAAQYLNSGTSGDAGVPVVKSEAKLAKKSVVKAPAIIAKPKILTPASSDRDQAYKIGMTHLVKGEFTKAKAYLEQAESRGHAEAGYNLASLYAKGDGVDQNFGTAVSYLKKSADRGYYSSMTNLVLLSAQGQGVEQNYLSARSLWLKAAAGEHPDAMHNLAVIYATGKGVDKDMDEAIKWYRKGANAGYTDSTANLGLIYANGDGVDRDYAEAKRLWETAAAKGHKVAAQNLEKLKKVMQ